MKIDKKVENLRTNILNTDKDTKVDDLGTNKWAKKVKRAKNSGTCVSDANRVKNLSIRILNANRKRKTNNPDISK